MRPPARTGSPPARSSVLAAVAGGVLLAAAFPLGPPALPATTDGWWALGWVCLAPMMVAAARASSRRNAALAGLAAGLVAYGLVFAWILPFLSRWGMLSAPEDWGVFLPMILYLASYTSTFCLCVRTFAGRWGEPAALLLAPAAWTALELIRAKILTGFPWCLLGYSQHGIPAAIQVADLAGVYGVSFQLASSAALLACIVTRPRTGGTARPSRRAAAAALGIVSALGPLYGAARLATMPAHSETIKAALVQANIPQSEKWDPREAARIELDHFAMTREAAAAGASLIVWSESAVPY
ncbi:MAG TPA: hypothetical protein VFP98_01610, partial [Candidatus Polarisedimenticolia bacterium]|nr:hypothetical protein [Candidatus Polarisedimenticolia bacterium]